MRKTNSKEVKETIKNYIMEHFNCYMDDNRGYFSGDLEPINNASTDNYTEVCNNILTIFWAEKLKHDINFKAGRANRYDLFRDWCSGLCSALDTDYYYNVSAVDLLGEWLEETESERARFDESKAEETITRLLWRELNAHATRTGILY